MTDVTLTIVLNTDDAEHVGIVGLSISGSRTMAWLTGTEAELIADSIRRAAVIADLWCGLDDYLDDAEQAPNESDSQPVGTVHNLPSSSTPSSEDG